MISYWHDTVICPSVMLCIVAKCCSLRKKCPNKWIGKFL